MGSVSSTKQSSFTPLEEGLHRSHFGPGQLRTEFTIKLGKMHGRSRRWHENGQLAEQGRCRNGLKVGIWKRWSTLGRLLGTSTFDNGTGIDRDWNDAGWLKSELSLVAGKITGRLRIWGDEQMLIGEQWYFANKPISKKKYQELCARDPQLPRFAEEKPATTLGKRFGQMQRAKAKQRELGPTPDDLAEQKWVDETSVLETRKRSSKEIVAWLKQKSRGETSLGEMTTGASLRFARKFYDWGAAKLWAAMIERATDGSQYTSHFVIKLPTNPKQKAAIYKYCIGNSSFSVQVGRQYLAIKIM